VSECSVREDARRFDLQGHRQYPRRGTLSTFRERRTIMATKKKRPRPPSEAARESELSDAELDPVAGGTRATKSVSTALPDVCKTPSPGGPVPIPYPVIVSKE
jgi:hypothetical protein